MFVLALTLVAAPTAFAEAPLPAELVRAQAFELQTPDQHLLQNEPVSYTRGWLLELRIDPAAARARQTEEPIVFVGDTAARRFNWDRVGGCAVVSVPRDAKLSTLPVFVSAPGLPERFTPSERIQRMAEATSSGIAPPSLEDVQRALGRADTAPLIGVSYDAVEAQAMGWVASCSQTPEDLQRAGVVGD